VVNEIQWLTTSNYRFWLKYFQVVAGLKPRFFRDLKR
jgi:hypothetical protein